MKSIQSNQSMFFLFTFEDKNQQIYFEPRVDAHKVRKLTHAVN